MTMLPERKSEQLMPPPPPSTQTPVEIRRYVTVDQFRIDAANMAAAGWIVVAQSETTGAIGGGWATLGALVLVLSVLFFLPGILLGLLLFIVAAVSRSKQLVVTYRPVPAS